MGKGWISGELSEGGAASIASIRGAATPCRRRSHRPHPAHQANQAASIHMPCGNASNAPGSQQAAMPAPQATEGRTGPNS